MAMWGPVRRAPLAMVSVALLLATLAATGGGHRDGSRPASTATPELCNVTSYGAKGDNATEDTAAVEAAIAACAGPRARTLDALPTVVFGPGTYLLRPVRLLSNTHLHFEAGAKIAAWRDKASWPNSTLKTCAATPYGEKNPKLVPRLESLLWAYNASNIAITGSDPFSNIVDGQGWRWWYLRKESEYWHNCRPKLLDMVRVSNMRVADITFQDSPFWTTSFRFLTDAVFERVRVHNTACGYEECPNTDGFNVAGENILIRDCTVRNGDDCVPVIAPSRNVTVENVTCECGNGVVPIIWTEHSVPGVAGDIEDVVFNNIVLRGTNTGIATKALSYFSGVVRNVTFSNVHMTSVATGVMLNMFNQNAGLGGQEPGSRYRPTSAHHRAALGLPPATIEGMRLINVTGSASLAGKIECASVLPCTGLAFDGVRLDAAKPYTCSNAHGTSRNSSPTPCLTPGRPVSAAADPASAPAASPHITFGRPAVVGRDYYTTGFQGFGADAQYSLGKTEAGWVGSADKGSTWASVLQPADTDRVCCPFPPGSHGTNEERCAYGNTLKDGFRYIFNKGRGLANATCGATASCWCCRCPATGPCGVPTAPVGDVGAVVLDAGGASLHNFGLITKVANHASSYTAFNASQYTRFSFANGSFVASVHSDRPIVFAGLPAPGASCGDHGEAKFGCPFRTGGRGYVKLRDGTLVMSIIVYLGGKHANPNPKLGPLSTSVVAYRSKDGGYHWDFAGVVLDAAGAPESEEGPNENDLVLLQDGTTIMAVIRLDAGDGPATHPYRPYVQSLSRDGGATWSAPVSLPQSVGCARPRLLRADGGQVVLSGGRLNGTNRDVILWLSPGDGDPLGWAAHSISYWHNRLVTNSSLWFTPAVNNSEARESTSYTSLVRTGPQTGFITYARHLPPHPDVAFAMPFSITTA